MRSRTGGPSGRWLATGGGGYDAYRVVPRTWALTWLAGAHREPDEETPFAWRARWEGDAAAFGTPGMPATFLDAPNAGQPVGTQQVAANEASLRTLERVRRVALPALVRVAEDRGWWRPQLTWAGRDVVAAVRAGARRPRPGIRGAGRRSGDRSRRSSASSIGTLLARVRLAPRTIPPFDPADALELLAAAVADGARVVGAIEGDRVVGVAVAARDPGAGTATRRSWRSASRRNDGGAGLATLAAGRARRGSAAGRRDARGVCAGGARRRGAPRRRRGAWTSPTGCCAAPGSSPGPSRPTSGGTTRGRSSWCCHRADTAVVCRVPNLGAGRSGTFAGSGPCHSSRDVTVGWGVSARSRPGGGRRHWSRQR